MKIALLTYSTRPRGGVVHTLSLAEALAALGHDVTVYAVGRGDITFFRSVDPRVRVCIAPLDDVPDESVGGRVLRSIDVLRDAVDPTDYAIVHAQDCISANAVPRCIRTVHHLDNFTTPELAACHERAIVTPRAHVCVSRAVARELAQGWDIHARVIPNGVDFARFASAQASRNGFYMLSVGGIEPRKGTIDLLEAYALVADAGLEWIIAGGETLFDYRDYRAEFDRRARALGVVPTVLGPVDHDALPGLVAGASVFAFPSIKEGFGLAAMEALAADVPVVVRDLPVMREVFGDAVTYASDPASLADAIRHPRHNPGPGRALAASLTWEAAAHAHLELYADLAPMFGH